METSFLGNSSNVDAWGGKKQKWFYRQIARGRIADSKYLLVSEREDGNLSIAQQVEVMTDGHPMYFLMKGAMVVDRNGLEEVVAILTEALDSLMAGDNE